MGRLANFYNKVVANKIKLVSVRKMLKVVILLMFCQTVVKGSYKYSVINAEFTLID